MTVWDDARLDAMRGLADPPADQAVAAVFERGQVGAVNALLVDLVRNDQLPEAADFPEVQAFLAATAALPAWSDPALLVTGQTLFRQWGLVGFGVLACAGLPECYVLGDVAAVLGRTQELQAHVSRRLRETTMMVLSVMDAGGLRSSGTGIRVVQKVRLMHAAIRHLLLLPPQAVPPRPSASLAEAFVAFRWDPARGRPISQEDLAAVILTFSHVVLRGWRDLGVRISAEEARAYLHGWNVVGHLLGVRRDLLIDDPEQAGALFEAIKRRRMADTADGRALTAALLADFDRLDQPRFVFFPSSRLLMHSLLTPQTCAYLGVPQLTWTERLKKRWLLAAVWFANAFKRDTFRAMPGLSGLSVLIATELLNVLVKAPRGARPPFQIPDELAAAWQIER